MRDLTDPKALSDRVLDWYDTHARELPWRIPPAQSKSGHRPDPYRIWLSEIMLQQTTVATVRGYFDRFLRRWPHITDLAAAKDGDVMGEWAGLGYYARARNLLKCARVVVRDHGSDFPADHTALLKLPGIGPYTAAAIASIAFDLQFAVLDGNVERVMARLNDVRDPLPGVKPDLMKFAKALTPSERPGDYAQAVMDLGATVCTPRSPSCGTCPWNVDCLAHRAGTASDLPRKAPKASKPVRRGIIYVGRRSDGAWLLERRHEKGLLGGMLGWPGTDWVDSSTPAPGADPPCEADWYPIQGEVRHTFTHFHLILAVFGAELSQGAVPVRGSFVPKSEFRPSDLPTVMRKALNLTAMG